MEIFGLFLAVLLLLGNFFMIVSTTIYNPKKQRKVFAVGFWLTLLSFAGLLVFSSIR